MNTRNRLLETLSMLMIGDGLLAVAAPRRHSLLWASSSQVGRLMRWFAAHPRAVRAIGVAETAAGAWLARRQWWRG